MKVFVSQPMSGLSDADIFKKRDELLAKASKWYGAPVKEVPSFSDYVPKGKKNPRLYSLGKSLTFLAEADLCVFAKGWDEARGCRIEREACAKYGVPYIDEEDL